MLEQVQVEKPYLHNRRAKVMVDGQHNNKVLIYHGECRGGVLSSNLFIIVINDLVTPLPNEIHAALYTDGVGFWCSEEYATTAIYRMYRALDNVTSRALNGCNQ